jgi:hypothetical protein
MQPPLTRAPTQAEIAYLESIFPALRKHHWHVSSDRTAVYNCIAFAAGVTRICWWPTSKPKIGWYWPANIKREVKLKRFVQAFETLGYEVCHHGTLEEGYEKIVIYTKDGRLSGEPTHAALQLRSGWWKSKIGGLEDIEHDAPEALTSPLYGHPVRYMKRAIASSE